MKKSRILITGANGFIGANLVRRAIKNKDNEVHVITREGSNLWRLENILPNERFFRHQADISDLAQLREIFQETQPDFIYHTAAYGGLPSQKDKLDMIKTNIIGTVNLLEASLETDYTYFINTGSSSEYGEKKSPMKESDLLEPNSEYGVTKSAATLYCRNFSQKNRKPIVTLRLFSVYGYFEDRRRLFPEVTLSRLNNMRLVIGKPDSVRDFIFIEDVLDAYEKFTEIGEVFYGEIFNIGSGEQHSVGEVVTEISKICGNEAETTRDKSRERDYDSLNWVADIKKIKELGWSQKFSFHEGIEANIRWFKENMNLYGGQRFNI